MPLKATITFLLQLGIPLYDLVSVDNKLPGEFG